MVEKKEEHKDHKNKKHHKHHGAHHTHHKGGKKNKSFIQIKDWDDDDDKSILESIKYAENKLGATMKTPVALPKEHSFAPVKYDVEEDGGAKDVKLIKKNLESFTAIDAGDCDVGDEKCRIDSAKIPTLAEAEANSN